MNVVSTRHMVFNQSSFRLTNDAIELPTQMGNEGVVTWTNLKLVHKLLRHLAVCKCLFCL